MFEPAAGSNATRISRSRKILGSRVQETGDPARDGDIWLSRLAKTRRQRMEQTNGEKDWMRYYQWYEGQGHWTDRGDPGKGRQAADNARETAVVNKVGSIVNSMVPFVVNNDIRFLLKPRKPSETISAELQQALLNYEWRERDMTRSVKMCVRDAAIIGHCVAKTGYTIEIAEGRAKADGEIVYADYIRKDAPYIERVNPLNFFFDLSAHDGTLHTARWCAEVFYVPLYDVLGNKDYDSKALALITAGEHVAVTRSAFAGTSESVWTDAFNASSAALPEDTLVVLIEIWDKKYKNRIIMADGVPIPLLSEKWPYDYLDNFPYAMANWTDVPNKPYGMGVMRNVEDQQNQLNRIRTSQFNHIRSHQRKFIAQTGIDKGELEKFTDEGDGAVIIAESTDAIKPIPDAAMSGDFQLIEGRIVNDINEGSGADGILQGQALPARTTAGEVGTRARIQGLKLDAIVDNVESFVEDLAVQILHHLKAWRTIPDVVEIVGAQGNFWREYTSEEIQADADVEVHHFNAPKEDPGIIKNQAIQIFQMATQALPVLAQSGPNSPIDMQALLGWVLDKFGERDIGRFFKPALAPRPPLVEGEQQNAGEGLPPALAGQFAPAQAPTQPQLPEQPGEGLTVQDLLAGLQSQSRMVQ
jgi:hypothetical protein